MVGEPTTEQAKRIHKARYSSVPMVKLRGARYTLKRGAHGYPDSLMNVPDPPETLYVLGSLDALCDGLAVVGARKATPYGMSAAEKFAGLAAAKGSQLSLAALLAAIPMLIGERFLLGGGRWRYWAAVAICRTQLVMFPCSRK